MAKCSPLHDFQCMSGPFILCTTRNPLLHQNAIQLSVYLSLRARIHAGIGEVPHAVTMLIIIIIIIIYFIYTLFPEKKLCSSVFTAVQV